MEYADYAGLNGADNMGGLKSILYFAPYNDFLLIKEFKTTTDPGDAVTIDGSHTFTSPAGFYSMYSTLDTAELVAKITGERDSRGLEQELKFFVPGNNPVLAELMRKAKNDTFIVLVEDINSTTGSPLVYQLGIKGLPAELFGEYSTGKLSSGKKGFEVTVKCFGNSMAYYEGTITLHA